MRKAVRGDCWRGVRCGIALITLVLLVIAQTSSAGASWMVQSSDLEEAKRLNSEVERLYQQGRYDEAIPLAERALAIREKAEKVLGPKQSDVAQSLNSLAILYDTKGDFLKAEPLYQRALTIYEKVLGPKHPDVAASLANLAVLYHKKGDYLKAEPLYQRALAIFEKALGPDHPNVAGCLNNLAELYQAKGDYVRAEPLYQRAIAIGQKALGPNHPQVATSLGNLANLYLAKGDYLKAEPLYQRALAIVEKALGPDHSYVAIVLNNLAGIYQAMGDFLKAEPLHQRALAIRQNALGPDHPDVATSLSNLANIYQHKGDYANAEPLYERALAIQEKTLGPRHADVATSLKNLALLYYTKGDYVKAEPLYQRALAIRQNALGPDHPDVATSLLGLAVLYEKKGDIAGAIAFQTRANDVIERNIALNLATGSERQKLAYLTTLSGPTWWAVSLHAKSAPNDLAALRLAFTTILRRKGRTLDATADSIGALSRRLNEQDRALLVQLTDTRSRLATLVLGGPGKTNLAEHGTEIKRLEEQVEKLEADISLRSAEYRAQSRPVSLEAVQAAIPQGAALVEFFSYYPLKDAKFEGTDSVWGEPRYVAYVLGGQGEPKWADLGEVKMIDNAVSALRNALRDPRRGDVKALARALDEKVMQPVRKLLGQTQKVFLSPDGSLNLIPFAALVDEQNRYLIEQYSFNYLTSGRDLLRLQEKLQSKQIAIVIANPDFGGDTSPCSEGRTLISRGAIDFSQVLFCPLTGTAGEAQAIKAMMPEANLLTKERATEAAIKQVSGPKILHIATHGFFLEDVVINPSTEGRGLVHQSNQSDAAMKVENPLLRSGLAMAGANLHKRGNDDGVLTALEAVGLDLWGTKLVVLSACDTGVGEVRNGDGVFGLRRALVLAGSESQVMSLWPVSDIATRDLMIDYYKTLQAGQGRGAALRQVQLKMLASEERQHPYYWASFIQSGEWADMDGKR